jgi:hypothetical protein
LLHFLKSRGNTSTPENIKVQIGMERQKKKETKLLSCWCFLDSYLVPCTSQRHICSLRIRNKTHRSVLIASNSRDNYQILLSTLKTINRANAYRKGTVRVWNEFPNLLLNCMNLSLVWWYDTYANLLPSAINICNTKMKSKEFCKSIDTLETSDISK